MSEWTAVTPDAPCEICGRDRWCSRNGSALRCTKQDSHPTYGQGVRHIDKNGGEWWLFNTGPSSTKLPEPTVEQTHQETLGDADTLHAVYSALLAEMELSPQHHTSLTRRGLTLQQATDFRDRLQYRSLPLRGRAAVVAKLIEAGHESQFPHVPGFIQKTGNVDRRYWTLAGSPGLLIPVRDVEGRIVALKIRRDDTTHGEYQWLTSRKKRDGKVCGVGPGAPVHVPIGENPGSRSPANSIRVTEGPLKADVATLLTGTLTIALPGVGSWKRVASVASSLDAKAVIIALDANSVRNIDVARALEGLTTELPQRGLTVQAERWDETDGKGIDDLLLTGQSPEIVQGAELHRWVIEVVGEAGKAQKQDDDRWPVEVSPDEHETNDAALAALVARESNLYVQQGRLVQVIREQDDISEYGAEWQAGCLRMKALPQASLRELLARHCFFFKVTVTDDGAREDQQHPPKWCVEALHSRTTWPNVRPIKAIIATPVIRPDGTVLNQPGWDAATRLLYEPIGSGVPEIPTEPTLSDAKAAAARLLELVRDFEFASDADRSAFLAALLTPIVRPAIHGFTPLFCFSAPTAGSGKSLLTDIISALSQGQRMPRMANPKDREETRKAVLALVLSGTTLVSMDNVSGALGNDVLDMVLTGETLTERILGGNSIATVSLLNISWFCTGNNITLKGDTFRRVLMIRLQPTVERPDQRTGFRIPDLIGHVKANRAALVSDAITIIHGFIRAGRPQADIPNWGSFEDWSRLIRQAIVWAGHPDPYGTVENIIDDADTERATFGALVDCWEDIGDGTSELTVSAIVKRLNKAPELDDPPGLTAAREAALELAGKDGKVDGRRLGNTFRDHDGQVFGDVMFTKACRKRPPKWTVRPLNRAAKCGDKPLATDSDFARVARPARVSCAPESGDRRMSWSPFTGGGEHVQDVQHVQAPEPEPAGCLDCQACGFDLSNDCPRDDCPTLREPIEQEDSP